MAGKSVKELSAQVQRVLDVLRKARQPLSAYDILDRVRGDGMRSPPTIYRALDVLESRGFAHRLATLNAFVACRCCKDHAEAAHAVPVPFMICSLCGEVQAVEDSALTRALRKTAARALAGVQSGVLEFTGLCFACEKTQGASQRRKSVGKKQAEAVGCVSKKKSIKKGA